MPPPTLRPSLADAHRLLGQLLADEAAIRTIDSIADALAGCLLAGGKILICGNGGSLCDAAHFAEELTGRFRKDRQPLAAIACADPGHITCTANDYGFEFVFSRWVEALGKPGDILIVLSTSGNSANILRAVEAAKAGGLQSVGLLGKGGGSLRGRCTHELIVPGDTSDRIQELHMLILHTWVEGIEARLNAEG
ncbi:D-sedoheptulose 7-phosphate isomerase [Phycisphaerales bacterium]|nr:D-sedoheptulose 7-phosphate isomerase [Phycisphaerales bacterium]